MSNVDGVNYVSPIRNQGQCGSCYAFASMAMLEARLRIATNNSVSVVLSPQDVMGCSEYSQGCAGGFPYLIAGKYAQDFGAIEESCFPYVGHDSSCTEKKGCLRYHRFKKERIKAKLSCCNHLCIYPDPPHPLKKIFYFEKKKGATFLCAFFCLLFTRS